MMKSVRALRTLVATVAISTAAFALTPAPAQAAALGEVSLVEVLAADGAKFDRNWDDFDIVERAALTVLEAKPSSSVGVLADGSVKLTAFIPTDRAFRKLVADLTGKTMHRERAVFNAVATLGVDTIETVLLYHVVPGARIKASDAVKADGAELTTAAGAVVKVNVLEHPTRVRLVDLDPDDRNAQVIIVDINKKNKQIAHGINRVLRPVNL